MNCTFFWQNGLNFQLKKQNIKKILENGKKYWKSQGILSVRKSGNPVNKLREKSLEEVQTCFELPQLISVCQVNAHSH